MIEYVKGDATRPQGDGPKAIVHICNDAGGWGAGFVLAISRRWKQPEAAYRAWHKDREWTTAGRFELGSVQWIPVGSDTYVVNMLAQKGYGSGEDSLPPIRYGALETCLREVARTASAMGATVHMPRIGCALAGGSWTEVSKIIERTLVSKGITVTVYDFPGSTFNL